MRVRLCSAPLWTALMWSRVNMVMTLNSVCFTGAAALTLGLARSPTPMFCLRSLPTARTVTALSFVTWLR